MLACNSISVPPWVETLALATALAWLAALLVAVPNVLMSCRPGKNPNYTTANLLFFAAYLLCGLSMAGGAIFNISLALGIIFIFLTPVMALGHFMYLLWQVLRERKARSAPAKPVESAAKDPAP